MLGRKNYTHQELDPAQRAIKQQLARYKKLAMAVGEGSDRQATAAALEDKFVK